MGPQETKTFMSIVVICFVVIKPLKNSISMQFESQFFVKVNFLPINAKINGALMRISLQLGRRFVSNVKDLS